MTVRTNGRILFLACRSPIGMYQLSQALSCVHAGMHGMQKDIYDLQTLVKDVDRQTATGYPPMAPPPAVAVATDFAELTRIVKLEVETSRRVSESGMRDSLRSSLLNDIKAERLLTESALSIRYDAMVSRMVKDHLDTAVGDLRRVVDETMSVVTTPNNEIAAVPKRTKVAVTKAAYPNPKRPALTPADVEKVMSLEHLSEDLFVDGLAVT